MPRPLTIVTLLYVGGILLAWRWPMPPAVVFVLTGMLALSAWFLARWRVYFLGGLVVCSGWANLNWRLAAIAPGDLRRLLGESAELVTVRGHLGESPSERVSRKDPTSIQRWLVPVEVEALQREGRWQPATGRILVDTPGEAPTRLVQGQAVELTGVASPPKSAVVDGLFDYRAYLYWQGIHYQVKTASLADWQMPPASGRDPVTDRFLRWAQATLARGLPAEDENLRLLWAMVLGWKTGLTNEVSQPFMRTGTMHIFAISGLHIALIAAMLVNLLRVMQAPRAWCGLVVIPLIWFYTLATGWQPSAIRSTLMMTLVIGGWSLRRPGDLLNALAAAGFLLLLWEPRQLFQTGFQLSFLVVLSIALLLPPLEQIRTWMLRSDPFLPVELRPAWRRRLDEPLRWVTSSVSVSLAAWLGTLPLIAYYFHLITPVCLLANLIIVPLSSLALMCALGSLLCGAWLEPVTVLLNHSAWFWMNAMVKISEWLASWPGAYVYVRAPGLMVFAWFYLLLFGLVRGWFIRPATRGWSRLALACLSFVILWGHWRERRFVEVTVLALDSGSAAFVDAPGNREDLLVDTGNSSATEFVVKPFLHSRGVNRLNRLLLTHGDVQHVGGATNLLRDFSPREVIASPLKFRSKAYREVIDQLPASTSNHRRVGAGDHLGSWTVLHPGAADRFAAADDGALVLSGCLEGTRVLMLSDLGRKGQRSLLERQPNLRVDVVIAGLPSNGEPLDDELLKCLQPRLVVIDSADYPVQERVKETLRERLAQSGIPTVYTIDRGSVRLRFHRGGWTVQTQRGESPGAAKKKSPGS